MSGAISDRPPVLVSRIKLIRASSVSVFVAHDSGNNSGPSRDDPVRVSRDFDAENEINGRTLAREAFADARVKAPIQRVVQSRNRSQRLLRETEAVSPAYTFSLIYRLLD